MWLYNTICDSNKKCLAPIQLSIPFSRDNIYVRNFSCGHRWSGDWTTSNRRSLFIWRSWEANRDEQNIGKYLLITTYYCEKCKKTSRIPWYDTVAYENMLKHVTRGCRNRPRNEKTNEYPSSRLKSFSRGIYLNGV